MYILGNAKIWKTSMISLMFKLQLKHCWIYFWKKFATIFHWTEIINKALRLTEISTFDFRDEIYLSNCNEIQILLVHLCMHSNAHTASFAKWLSDGLRSQRWWVRVLLHSLQFQITSLFWARGSLKLRWLHGVDSLDTCMWHDKKT